MRRSQESQARSALQQAAHDGSLRPDRVHDREGVGDAGFEVRRTALTARTTDPAPVVHDHARELGEAFVDEPIRWRVPPFVDDREEVVLPNQIDRTVSEDLVREIRTVLGTCERDAGLIHGRILRACLRGRNPGGG